jgi:hypothetical protein
MRAQGRVGWRMEVVVGVEESKAKKCAGPRLVRLAEANGQPQQLLGAKEETPSNSALGLRTLNPVAPPYRRITALLPRATTPPVGPEGTLPRQISRTQIPPLPMDAPGS